jgi:hypothetical protein
MATKPTRNQWDELDAIYSQLPDLSTSYSATGLHYQLIACLGRMGYNPNGREAAVKLAEKILSGGWK